MDLTVLGTGVTLRLLAVEFHADPGDGGKRCRAGAGGVHRNVERLRRDGFGRFGGVGAVRIVLMQQLRLAERERAETGQAGQPGKVDGERVCGVLASRLTASSRPVRACSSHVTTASMAGTSPYASVWMVGELMAGA